METWPAEAVERIAALEAENAMLKARLDELEERLGMNSRNSSKPPSSDGPEVKRPRGRPTKRKQGGQRGHAGHRRQMLPVGKADRILVCLPGQCGGCGEPLVGKDRRPRRYQVLDVPPLRLEVTEYQQHRLRCAKCGAVTAGTLPPGVAERQFGIGIQALVALWGTRYQLSKRQIAELFGEMFGDGPSAATVSALEQPVSAALATPWRQMRTFVRAASIQHIDETSWTQGGKREWLWCLGPPKKGAAWFRIQPRRSRLGARRMLGATKGVVVSDRHSAYDLNPDRQICWAHVRRTCQGMAERNGSRWHGVRLLNLATRVLLLDRRFRDGRITFEEPNDAVIDVRRLWNKAVQQAATGAIAPKARHQCEALRSSGDHLWTFLTDPDIEPTNNTAERRLRRPVIKRKLSFGTQTTRGSRFIERSYTTVVSLREQGRPILPFIADALRAYYARADAPSLLPAIG
ncbi:MAG: IS66 family transposase [Ardenticatenales bacterium]|nr:IS66 family transposase [Ardenticatenales bacterium]